MQRVFNSVVDTIFSRPHAAAHDSYPAILKRRVHIREVEVHMSVHRDNLRDAFSGGCQGIIGFPKRVHHGEILINISQSLVVDDQQSIHVFGNLFHSFESLYDLSRPFKHEGDGHDPYREDSHIFGHPCHHGCCSCSSSSTHTGGNENHAGTVVEQIFY